MLLQLQDKIIFFKYHSYFFKYHSYFFVIFFLPLLRAFFQGNSALKRQSKQNASLAGAHNSW